MFQDFRDVIIAVNVPPVEVPDAAQRQVGHDFVNVPKAVRSHYRHGVSAVAAAAGYRLCLFAFHFHPVNQIQHALVYSRVWLFAV